MIIDRSLELGSRQLFLNWTDGLIISLGLDLFLSHLISNLIVPTPQSKYKLKYQTNQPTMATMWRTDFVWPNQSAGIPRRPNSSTG